MINRQDTWHIELCRARRGDRCNALGVLLGDINRYFAI